MSMDRGSVLFAAAAVLLALLFARLGWWQLERHDERRELNERRRARMSLPTLSVRSPGDLADLPPASQLAWRRLQLRGRWDYRNEILLRPRSHAGRPAIELLTPLLLGPDTAVLVLRGWLSSPDALHAPIREARSPSATASPAGFVLLPEPADAERADAASARVDVDEEEHLALRRVDLEIASNQLPYYIAKFYVMQINEGAGFPLRALPAPELTTGPHLSYAIQWFAFALVALVGTGLLLGRGGDGT